jgi:predicted transcriptional regulator
MTVLKIGIAPYEEMRARTLAIARGDLKPGVDDPKIWFTSTESFAKVLSSKNRALLATIAATHPASLQELAERTGRKASNLSRTLKTMERYGFVLLRHGARGRIQPEVPYQGISLELSFSAIGHDDAGIRRPQA